MPIRGSMLVVSSGSATISSASGSMATPSTLVGGAALDGAVSAARRRAGESADGPKTRTGKSLMAALSYPSQASTAPGRFGDGAHEGFQVGGGAGAARSSGDRRRRSLAGAHPGLPRLPQGRRRPDHRRQVHQAREGHDLVRPAPRG